MIKTNNFYIKNLASKPLSIRSVLKLSQVIMPTKVSKAWLSLWLLSSELENIYTKSVDQSVRAQKINWWSEELFRLSKNQASHPITRFVHESTSSFFKTEDPFKGVLNYWIELNSYIPFLWVNQNELSLFSNVLYGEFEKLMAMVVLKRSLNDDEISIIGLFTDIKVRTELLQNFGLHLRNGHIPIPISVLNNHQLLSQEILLCRSENEIFKWEELTEELIKPIQSKLILASSALNEMPRKTYRSLWLLRTHLEIYQKLIEIIENQKCAVLSQHIDISPRTSIFILFKNRYLF